MTERTIFVLTIRYYPRAAEAGVTPFEPGGYPMDDNPAYYRSRSFNFDEPPSRQDFLDLCRKHLPWTQVWDNTLLPLIERGETPWPMVDYGKKAGDVDIINENGLKVGRIKVSRDYVYGATGYDRIKIFVTHDNVNNALKGVAKDRRDQAYYCVVVENEDRIQERLSTIAEVTDEKVRAEIRRVLVDNGFLKSKAKRKLDVVV